MIDKYLPIGTVCTLKGNNKKIMIVGFFSIEYNGNIKMYDYQGCPYPEGLLLKSRLVSFNHNDVEKIDFLGYKDILHDNFNKILLKNTSKLDIDDERKTTIANFQFDENGVVIFDGTVSQDMDVLQSTTLEREIEIDNPFNRHYEPEIRPVNKNQSEILSPYVFDENGIIIAENPVTEKKAETKSNNDSPYIFDENGVIIGEKGQEEVKNSNFKFDENGVVISDGTAIEENSVNNDSPYIFDKNGIVIGEKGQEEVKNSNFKFDENGVVISDGIALEETSVNNDSPYIFDKNGIIIGEKGQEEARNGKFKFDENGIVVSEE